MYTFINTALYADFVHKAGYISQRVGLCTYSHSRWQHTSDNVHTKQQQTHHMHRSCFNTNDNLIQTKLKNSRHNFCLPDCKSRHTMYVSIQHYYSTHLCTCCIQSPSLAGELDGTRMVYRAISVQLVTPLEQWVPISLVSTTYLLLPKTWICHHLRHLVYKS